MNESRVHFPRNRLAAVISNTSPRVIRECIEQAESNLKLIAGDCAAHIETSLCRLEHNLSGWPTHPDAEYLASLYEPCLSMIGSATVAGLPDLDQAAKSLCDVLDGFWATSTWERDPVQVHIASMRLLQQPAALGAAATQVLEGLQKVRSKYKPRQAAMPAATT